ncbi:MAG: hypothetical protein A2152_04060 [Candidatus Levybacteria bacterium RBG_16_35_6]|nr:MAG: hypothetical protein A2152_04060 [Candidatus Levybacteria bacterium RBG_16_35_6]
MKRIIAGILLIIVVVAGVLVWYKSGLEPANSKDQTPKIFVVKKGDGIREISYNLKHEGLIKDPIVFFLQIKRLNLDKQIQAGDFRLNPSMNASEIAYVLTHGTLDIWVTIPEGLRAEEIADIFKERLPSYKSDWQDHLIANEGYLFPDTYLIPKDADVNTVLSLMKTNFQNKFDSVKQTKTTNLTDQETLTVASLIEREAKYEKDRPLVASVILNRLDLGMALQIDATVQYDLGYQTLTKNWWKENLTANDLKISSPYNTYSVVGLPPTPISNPGLSAISAALNPTNTDYLYYISDKNGNLHFSTSLEGHNANIKKYGL